jgi:uncharacterized protein YodC (DUF2158 family)
MAITIKPGDVVQLKSGGPIMVAGAPDKGLVRCCWFEKRDEIEEPRAFDFPPEGLKPAQPP